MAWIGSIRSPAISVLIPVYNRQDLIDQAVESALRQTFEDLAVVVVDNASTDCTWEICQQLRRKDPRVRTFRNATNLGPLRNWWRCVEEARGQLAKLLFSDDLMRPEFLEKTIPWLDDPEVAFCFTMTEIGPEPGHGSAAYSWLRRSGEAPSRAFIRAALRGENVPVSPGAGLFRLEDLQQDLRALASCSIGQMLSQSGAGADLLLYLLTATRYRKVAFIREPLIFFRSHAGSITHSVADVVLAHDYYAARLWFAVRYGTRRDFHEVLARAWLSRIRHDRRYGLPRTGDWLPDDAAVPVSAMPFLRGACRAMASKLGKRLRA